MDFNGKKKNSVDILPCLRLNTHLSLGLWNSLDAFRAPIDVHIFA